jgi:hypothetical protein
LSDFSDHHNDLNHSNELNYRNDPNEQNDLNDPRRASVPADAVITHEIWLGAGIDSSFDSYSEIEWPITIGGRGGQPYLIVLTSDGLIAAGSRSH